MPRRIRFLLAEAVAEIASRELRAAERLVSAGRDDEGGGDRPGGEHAEDRGDPAEATSAEDPV
jgi:hypothetical protein